MEGRRRRAPPYRGRRFCCRRVPQARRTLPIAAEVEGAPALRDDASGVSTFAWHAPGAAPDALQASGAAHCRRRQRLLHAAALGAPTACTTADAAASAPRPPRPRPPTPPTPSASPAVPATPPTPTDGHLGVGGDALGTGALLGPLRRRVAAVLASDKFAASLIDRLRVEEARETAALAAVAPEAALTEASLGRRAARRPRARRCRRRRGRHVPREGARVCVGAGVAQAARGVCGPA